MALNQQNASESVKGLVSQALQHDYEGRAYEAYECYLKTLHELIKTLMQDVKPGGLGSLTPPFIKLGKQCMDRLHEMVQDNLVHPAPQHSVETPSPSVSETSSLSSSFEPSPIDEAEKQNKRLLEAYRRRQVQQGRSKTNTTEMNLSLQRKMAENVAVAKARQEAILRKVQERHRHLQSEASKQLQSSVGMSAAERERRTLYLQVLQYEQSSKPLLEWRERLSKQSQNSQALSSLVKYVLSLHDHPFTKLIEKYKENLDQQLKSYLERGSEGSGDEKAHHKELVQTIRCTLDHVWTMWPVLYEDMESEEARDVCYACTEDVFFKDLWRDIFKIFRLLNRDKERDLTVVLSRLHSAPPQELGVSTKFQLGEPVPTRYAYPYQAVVTKLQTLGAMTSPLGKLGVIVDASQLVCHCVEEHYQLLGPDPPPAIGADDLLPILSFILVRLGDSSIISECHAMEEFIHEGYILGEEGYCLTSVQTALFYLLTLTSVGDG